MKVHTFEPNMRPIGLFGLMLNYAKPRLIHVFIVRIMVGGASVDGTAGFKWIFPGRIPPWSSGPG